MVARRGAPIGNRNAAGNHLGTGRSNPSLAQATGIRNKIYGEFGRALHFDIRGPGGTKGNYSDTTGRKLTRDTIKQYDQAVRVINRAK